MVSRHRRHSSDAQRIVPLLAQQVAVLIVQVQGPSVVCAVY